MDYVIARTIHIPCPPESVPRSLVLRGRRTEVTNSQTHLKVTIVRQQAHSYRSRIFPAILRVLSEELRTILILVCGRSFVPAAATAAEMKVLLVVTALAVLAIPGTSARGRVFNRFSPEILANLGYGGHGGMHHRTQPFFEVSSREVLTEPVRHSGLLLLQMDNMIEEEPFSMELKKSCYGNLCTSNDYCCPGTVCDWDGTYGRCVFMRGRRLGELCRRDADCESGFICAMSAGSLASVCSVPLSSPKQYNEECETSSDCDITRGLCCQLQRRHRQTHRKVGKTYCASLNILLLLDLDLPCPALSWPTVLTRFFFFHAGLCLLRESTHLHRQRGCGRSPG